MRLELAEAANRLLETGGGTSSQEVGAVAARVCEDVTRHFSRLVGIAGIHVLLDRSIALTKAGFPWLAGRVDAVDSPWEAVRASIEQQPPDAAKAAFVVLLSTFGELVGRLIGDPLTAHLLNEIWPDVFRSATDKETT